MLQVESVRARLTLYHVGALATALLVVGGLIYVLLARALYGRIDDNLESLLQTAAVSLANDLAEGQDSDDAASSTAAELATRLQMLAVYDREGRLLAERERDEDLEIVLPSLTDLAAESPYWMTVLEVDGDGDRHRLAIRQVEAGAGARESFIVVAGSSLEAADDELAELRQVLFYLVPIALAVAGLGGWFLAHRSLAPMVAMAERARAIGGQDLTARLPVANPRDELGHLAETFNQLLARIETAMTQQRHFMADASHELRTPVTIARTAAAVALQQPSRDEREYRDTLAVVEQQTTRLSRLVEDMFTLARADSGQYPVRRDALYLDEVVEEEVRAARVIATTRQVDVEMRSEPSLAMEGDEALIRRMVGNLLDNAIRHTRPGSTVQVEIRKEDGGCCIEVTDAGPGIPEASRALIFERFYRVDPARSRGRSDGGAGLGLALARWIARMHGGDLELTRSSDLGSTFTARLQLTS